MDGIESAYLSFYPKQIDFNSLLVREMKINKGVKSLVGILSIPHREEEGNLIINSLQLIKLFFIFEVSKFTQDKEKLILYADIFDKKYISNNKKSMYAYLLEFYVTYMWSGKNVNIYVKKDDLHIMSDLELDGLSILFWEWIGTHIAISFADIVEKIYSKRVEPKYIRMFLNKAEQGMLFELMDKSPIYTKKRIIIDFDANEIAKSMDIKGTALLENWKDLDNEVWFWEITKVKHAGKPVHIKVSKKISLKKNDKTI